MENVVVGLDLHLKRTQGTVMTMDGRIVKQEKFDTDKWELWRFLKGLPPGTKVALEAQGFCWPWIDYIEEMGYTPLLVNPIKAKQRAEDVKTDKVDSEVLAHLTRMDWLPTVYIPSKEMRELRNLLRHRAFRRKISTALKNRTWSELRKRDIQFQASLDSFKGRQIASRTGVYEIQQNVGLIDLVEKQMKGIEAILKERYSSVEPVKLLQTIPGIGFITALGMYAEICDIKRFPTSEKLAHYAGLVPRVRQSGEQTRLGREVKANRWLKWLFIEAAWSHINWCKNGKLAKVFEDAYRRKKDKKKAIKVVARKLVDVVWAIWTYKREFTMIPEEA
jgi:transposase